MSSGSLPAPDGQRRQCRVPHELETWLDSRGPLAAPMNAALAPFMPYWLSGFASAEDADSADRERIGQLVMTFDPWATESHPQWYTKAHASARPSQIRS
jgi:hypothetical protein